MIDDTGPGLDRRLVDAGARWRHTLPPHRAEPLRIATLTPQRRRSAVWWTALGAAAAVTAAIVVPVWLIGRDPGHGGRAPATAPTGSPHVVSQDVALAPPVPASGTGTRVIDLGPAPEGTTFIRVKFNCLSAGTFEMQDGSHLSCSAADVRRQQQLLGQPSHYLSQFRLPFTGLESVEVKTQSNARWSLEADYIKTVGATSVDEALLASALAANPEVRLEMTGQTASHGVVLCGTNLVGRNTAGNQLYVWLLCADFTTGPHATMLTASSEPALITVSGTGAEVRVISAQFPSQEHIDADIDRMFPPAVAARMRAGNLPTVPNQAQLLATARLLVPRRTVLGQVLSSTKVTSGFRVTLSPSKRLLAQDTFVPIPGRAPETYLIPNSLVLDGGASLVGEIEVTVVGHRVVGLAIVGG